jgi:hypothetical protein
MDTNRRHTTMAGALIIIGMVAGVLSIVPVIEQPHYLALVSGHRREIMLGAAFQLIMIPAYVGFALALHPTLTAGSEALSLGFVGFRLIAGMCHLLGVLLLPLFVVLGHAYGHAAAPEASQIELLGELLRSARDLVNHVALILALAASDLLLFRILHRWRLVPRWLAVWGFLGAALAMLASLLVLSDLLQVVTPAYLAMNAPLALQGLVFAVWLITRGLDTSLLQPRFSTRTLS